jgi:hypothetical protein
VAPGPESVTAAPNRCRLTARVADLRRSEVFPDKSELEIYILESEAITGPNFARPGERKEAFTLVPVGDLAPGNTIRAEAEFLGDERGGKFQLYQVNMVS